MAGIYDENEGIDPMKLGDVLTVVVKTEESPVRGTYTGAPTIKTREVHKIPVESIGPPPMMMMNMVPNGAPQMPIDPSMMMSEDPSMMMPEEEEDEVLGMPPMMPQPMGGAYG